MTEAELNSLSEKVIGCSYTISNALGSGFLEKVYMNALAHELRKLGLKVELQKPLHVIYDGVVVGEYFADMLIEGVLIIELKACNALNEIHKAQCINYLNSTQLPLCLLINFGRPRVEVKRIFQSQYLKNI
ncbi:MAG: GxxExxY protein [Acidobacteria bacterium]|nr:GxxExxY protein [Acidobacteriota bacterium]